MSANLNKVIRRVQVLFLGNDRVDSGFYVATSIVQVGPNMCLEFNGKFPFERMEIPVESILQALDADLILEEKV
jgi:hypothetical protein